MNLRTALLLTFCLALPLTASAVSFENIFGDQTKASPQGRGAVVSWLRTNCRNLSWVLSIREIPEAYESCGDKGERIQLQVTLSHLTSKFTFWVDQEQAESGVFRFSEEQPGWQLCSPTEDSNEPPPSCSAQN